MDPPGHHVVVLLFSILPPSTVTEGKFIAPTVRRSSSPLVVTRNRHRHLVTVFSKGSIPSSVSKQRALAVPMKSAVYGLAAVSFVIVT